jgi:hypothetical protein
LPLLVVAVSAMARLLEPVEEVALADEGLGDKLRK